MGDRREKGSSVKILILETGIPPEGLDKSHGTYPDMFRAMLSPQIPGLETIDWRVDQAPLAEAPVGEVDGLLVTGSPAGVYDDHDWIAPLEDCVRQAVASGKPVVGICFGHQLMARAYGGRVEKSARGWGTGIHTYEVIGAAPFMAGEKPARIACAVSHQDQVIEPPATAVRLGGSAFCPYGILSYSGGRAVSFQMHPEFTHDYAEALMSLRSDRIPDDVRALAMPSLAHGSDRSLIARWIANFFLAAGDRS